FAIDLLADASLGQLFGRAVADVDGPVFKNCLISRALGAEQMRPGRFLSAEIDGAEIGSEMEGDGGQRKTLLKHCGKQMLASVLLHVVEAAGATQGPLHQARGEAAGGEGSDV